MTLHTTRSLLANASQAAAKHSSFASLSSSTAVRQAGPFSHFTVSHSPPTIGQSGFPRSSLRDWLVRESPGSNLSSIRQSGGSEPNESQGSALSETSVLARLRDDQPILGVYLAHVRSELRKEKELLESQGPEIDRHGRLQALVETEWELYEISRKLPEWGKVLEKRIHQSQGTTEASQNESDVHE